MKLTLSVAWNIFWRTFAQLAAAALLAVFGAEALDIDLRVQGFAFLLAVISAAIGGLVAVGWAFVQSPATTALEKALRSAAEKLIAVLIAIPINNAADLVAAPRLIYVGLGAVVLAFLVTYFQNQGVAPAPAGARGT